MPNPSFNRDRLQRRVNSNVRHCDKMNTLAGSKTSVVSICPLCGKPNECAIAEGSGRVEDCWCMNTAISSNALAKLPQQEIGRTCICRKCAAMSAQTAKESAE